MDEPPDLYSIDRPVPDVVLDGDWELVRCSRGRVVTSPSVDKSLDRTVVLDSRQYSLPPDLAAIKPAIIALSQRSGTAIDASEREFIADHVRIRPDDVRRQSHPGKPRAGQRKPELNLTLI